MSLSIDSNQDTTKITLNTKLTRDMIDRKQQPYPKSSRFEFVPTQDTLEVQTDKPNQKWYQKHKGILIGVSAAALAAGAFIFGKKKIDAEKIKKAEAEARRLEAEARQKATEAEHQAKIKEAEELQAKMKAEAEARQKAKLEAEAKAKAKAEEDARIEAERAKEAERLAELAEYNKKVEAATAKFDERCVIKPHPNNLDYKVIKETDKALYGTTLNEYGQFFVDTVKKAEEDGIKPEDITKIYQKMHDSAALTDAQIGSITSTYSAFSERGYNAKHQLIARRDFIRDIDTLKTEIPQQEGEKLSDYLQRLINKRKENVAKEKQKRIETIKSRLHYETSIGEKEKIELTTDEVEELRAALIKRKIAKTDKERMQNADLNHLISEYITESTGDYDAPEVSDRIQKACFNHMSRYNSTTSMREFESGRDKTFVYEPLYRWMSKGKECDKFTEETFKIGETYTFPWKQSCSKNKYYAETSFCDTNSEKNFKFVIHPKSETSRAIDIGYGNYGCNEAVYNKGEQFRIIDIYDEEVTNVGQNIDKEYWQPRSFYHKVVHLQEL